MHGKAAEASPNGEFATHYRQIVEASPDLICTFQAGGVLTFVNEAYCRFFGRTRDGLLGTSFKDLALPDQVADIEQLLASLAPDIAPFTVEFELTDFQGRRRWIQWTDMAIHDDDGNFQGYQAIGRDITDKKTAEKIVGDLVGALAPQTGKAFFRTLVNYLAQVCGVEIAMAGEIDPKDSGVINTLAVSQRGQTADDFSYQLKGTPCADLLKQEFCFVESELQRQYPEDDMLTDLGLHSYMGIPLHSSEGDPIGLLSMIHTGPIPNAQVAAALFKITAARAAAELDRQRVVKDQLLFRSLIDRSTDSFVVIDMETGQFLDINERARQEHGFTREEYLQLTVFDMDPRISRTEWRNLMEVLRRDGSLRTENVYTRKDGSTFPVEVFATYAKVDREYCVAVVHDVTEKHRAEAAIRKSQQQLAAIAATMPQALYVFDIQTQENTYSNRRVWEDLGYTRNQIDEMGSRFTQQLIHPEDGKQIPELLARWKNAKDGEVLSFEYRMRAADGIWRWFEARDTVFKRDANGAVMQIIGTATDISDRKAAEEEIADSERRLSAIAATMPQALYVLDLQDGSFTFANQPFCDALGMTAEEIKEAGTSLLPDVIHSNDLERLPQLADRWKDANDHDVFETELRVRNQAGQWRWFSTRETVFHRNRDGQVHQLIGTAKDITEQKSAEEERRRMAARVLRAQKLESLGVLAGGIAHDFNNLLTVILSFTGLAKSRADQESPLQPMLAEIEHTCTRASDLTKQMLAYAGRGRFVVEDVQLDELVDEMSRLLRRVIPEAVEIESSIEPAQINGDATQMRQVIMNLIKNAADAVQDQTSGRIHLATGVREFQPAKFSGHSLPEVLPAGSYAFIRVRDNGCGLASETIEKIFDPFFSTKSNGQGLGLAAALGIVRGHLGAILVDCQKESGTRFEVLIPVSKKGIISETLPDLDSHGARVLVVDDEPKICDLAADILQQVHFEVQTADAPKQALAMIANAEVPYSLIVLDLRMQEMSGEETLRRIRAIAHTPVIIISGCDTSEIEARLQGQAVEGILHKPFSAEELVETVRKALANRKALT